MRLLFDTNVVLDLLLAREPFAEHARRLSTQVARGELTGLLGATTVTTVFYLSERRLGTIAAHAHLSRLLSVFSVAPVTESVIHEALRAGRDGFEDAVLHEAALLAGADAIVTRDISGFRRASCPVHTPTALLASLAGRA